MPWPPAGYNGTMEPANIEKATSRGPQTATPKNDATIFDRPGKHISSRQLFPLNTPISSHIGHPHPISRSAVTSRPTLGGC